MSTFNGSVEEMKAAFPDVNFDTEEFNVDAVENVVQVERLVDGSMLVDYLTKLKAKADKISHILVFDLSEPSGAPMSPNAQQMEFDGWEQIDKYLLASKKVAEAPMLKQIREQESQERSGTGFGWNITYDHLDKKKVDIMGPKSISDETVKKLKNGEGTAFKIYDGDGELYYEGRMIENGGEEQLAPLDDYGTPNAGATALKKQDKNGEWVAVN